MQIQTATIPWRARLGLCLTLLAGPAYAAEAPAYEDAQIRLWLKPRTPSQMAAFYEARGFPAAMLARLRGYCFITVGLHNKSAEVVWLELENWRFVTEAGGAVERVPRSAWPSQWAALGVPLASQATFRWTLLPEVLDFRPDEREGGNVVLLPPSGTFGLLARFVRGAERRGGVIEARVDQLRCPREGEP